MYSEKDPTIIPTIKSSSSQCHFCIFKNKQNQAIYSKEDMNNINRVDTVK